MAPQGGEATKAAIIEAAERLFAERGLKAVSLREINTAAHQRNNSALQYHFDGRDGLLRAICAKHLAVQTELRQATLASLNGDLSPSRRLAEVIVRPAVELCERDESSRCYVLIAAQLASDPEFGWPELMELVGDPLVRESLAAWARHARQQLPREIVEERSAIVSYKVICAVAVRAKQMQTGSQARQLVSAPLFSANLVEMVDAALSAPVPTGPGLSSDQVPV